MSELASTLLAGWAGCLAGGLLLWLWSLAARDAGVADVGWGLYFVGLTAWARWRGPEAAAFHAVHAALVTAWGSRLALHILVRGRGRPEDPRYAAMRERHGERFAWVGLGTVFLLQATLAALLAAPLVAVQLARSLHVAGFAAGVALWLSGMFWEVVADEQLRRFRADPASRGRVLERGLWRYSRHPNYFGEALLWWGYGVMAWSAGAPWALVAPAAMTWLLLRVSGVTLLERTIVERRPEYARYVERTSAFLPRPPRDRAPGPSPP
jgi:steroid 5-alpha reductase family enzyme